MHLTSRGFPNVTNTCDTSKRTARVTGLLAIVLLLGCSQRTSIRSLESVAGQTMGTSYSVKYLPSSTTPGITHVSELIDSVLDSVNAQMSTYRDDSEVTQFNQHSSTEWFPVSKETAEVVKLSLHIYEITDRCFDVTVGPLVDLWGFGPPNGSPSIPSQEEINAILRRVGSDKLEVRLDPPALRKTIPDLRVDLSAIAKGHGVDRIADALDELAIEHYFVEIGGEIRTKGQGIHGQPWKVGIEKPDPEKRQVMKVVGLSDRSMATSGDYRNFRSLENELFSHFIDPKSGWPVKTEVAAVTVLASDCATADALATGLMSAGLEKAQKLAAENSWPALFVVRVLDGLDSIETAKFQEWIADDKQ